ncbi:MAG TPA: zinc-binding dehydrogenase [Chloroflexota bacterium]|nr:zinc-binding dehydrogenase [Chloroflexota bacterium]
MRAVRFYGPGDLRVEEVAEPRAGPGEVVVRVEVALTDGTDLKAYLRGHRLFRPPMAFGHELVGTVVEVGAGVDRFTVGDRVVPANSAPCRRCFYCQRGRTSLCERLDERLNWGAYAELMRITAPIVGQNMHRLPEGGGSGVSEEAFAATEPLACVVAGVDAAEVRSGDAAVVLGGTGAIGLLFVQLLRQAGVSPVIAVGRSAERLELARQLGADLALPADDRLGEKVGEATGRRGADVVIEATGQPAVWEQAPALLRRGGTALMFGGCPSGTRFSLDTGRVHYDALTIRGVFHHTPATFERAFGLIAAGRVRIDPLIGARGGLADVEPLLKRMADREIVKAAIRPNDVRLSS